MNWKHSKGIYFGYTGNARFVNIPYCYDSKLGKIKHICYLSTFVISDE